MKFRILLKLYSRKDSGFAEAVLPGIDMGWVSVIWNVSFSFCVNVFIERVIVPSCAIYYVQTNEVFGWKNFDVEIFFQFVCIS